MNILTMLFAVALVIAAWGFAYRLVIMFLVAPNVVRKYGAQDLRSQKWIARVRKMCNRKILLGYVIIILLCLLNLAWIAIKTHVFLTN